MIQASQLRAALSIVCAAVTVTAPVTAGSQAAAARHTTTSVVLLGTGTPVPDPRTAGPSTAVVFGKRLFIFDAGAGVQRQLSKAHLSNTSFEAVFFTHLHSDHTLGYPDLVFTSWVFGRSAPLKAFGPPGLKRMTSHLIAAFEEDIEARTKGPEHAIPNGYRVNATDVVPGIIYDSAGVRVRAIAVPHNIGRPAYAYRIDTPDRSIVISGDTGPSDVLISWARDADVLVHEVVNMNEMSGKMPGGADTRTYMRTTHTPADRLGQIAARVHPKLLVLTHIVPSGTDETRMLKAVRAGGFKGRVVFGRDMDRY
jgi:ribonuclease BN (tRNA processing enzyme)